MKRNMLRYILILVFIFTYSIALCESQTIISTGKFVMGDNDSKADAKKLALLEAKRLALEEAGTYLTSSTEVKNFQLTNDEISSLAAGTVSVKVIEEKWTMEGEAPVVTITINADIRTDDLAERIKILKENKEDVENYSNIQSELASLKKELEALKAEKQIPVMSENTVGSGQNGFQADKQDKMDKIMALEKLNAGIIDLINNRHENAIANIDESIRLSPDNAEAYLKRAAALLRAGRTTAAFIDIDKAIRLNPDSKKFLLSKRIRILKDNNEDFLIRLLSTAIRRNPECEVYYLLRGDAFFEKKMIKKATSDYKTACRKGSGEGCKRANEISRKIKTETRKRFLIKKRDR